MDSLCNCVLRSVLATRKDLFGENATFVSFEAQQFRDNKDGLQSAQRFGRIVYTDGHRQTKYSNSLFLKVTPAVIPLKEFTILQFFNEVVFYTKILPFLHQTSEPETDQHLFARYYDSLLQYKATGDDDDDDAVIIFENLQSKGYSPPDKYSFLDYDHLRLIVRKLGVFHAYSYRAREVAPTKFDAWALSRVEADSHVLRQYDSLRKCAIRGFQSLATDPDYSSRVENLRSLIDNLDEVYIKGSTGDRRNRTHVFCHGDFLRNNVLFAYDQKGKKPIDLKIVDLATWRFASPVKDLALVLYLNADQKMRDENWDNLIDEYYAAVRGTFPSTRVPTKDAILAEFKTNVLMAYAIASYFLPQLISRDYKDVPTAADLLPDEYRNAIFSEIPAQLLEEAQKKEGGFRATTALTNILKDFVDRGFV